MTIKRGSVIECEEPGPHGKLVVAVIGYAHDWAAYEMTYPDQITAQDVADRGDKISKEDAIRLFPEFASLRYRP